MVWPLLGVDKGLRLNLKCEWAEMMREMVVDLGEGVVESSCKWL